MREPVRKRSVIVAGHKTSVSLEDAFWKALRCGAADADMTISAYLGEIDANRLGHSLSSSVRLSVLAARDARICALQDELAPHRKSAADLKCDNEVRAALGRGKSLLSDEQRRILGDAVVDAGKAG